MYNNHRLGIILLGLALSLTNTFATVSIAPAADGVPVKDSPTTDNSSLKSSATQYGTFDIQHATFRALKGAQNGSVYFTITQKATENDRLISASCAFSKTVEIHNHLMDEKLNIKKMVHIPNLLIPGTHANCWFITCPFTAKENPVELKKGGLHLMLMEMKPETCNQKEIEVILVFEKAGSITVPFKAESLIEAKSECKCPHHDHKSENDDKHHPHDHKQDQKKDHKSDHRGDHNHDYTPTDKSK